MRDKAGREIQLGDVIVYGHALGRCAGMQYGKVIGFGERIRWDEPNVQTVKVRGVDSDWHRRDPKLLKPGRLWFSERMLVVREDQVPADVWALLATVEVAALSEGAADDAGEAGPTRETAAAADVGPV